ncbi:flavin-containing monooxygenase [Mycobacterium kyorinense]|uniref:Monooxygenase n=1 Tax=Mycobacterium kyorinense TaxID=487514 RepID=A0A1X1XAF8_9MYCO|nr:NAD(P)/FAD-dependent oxidoreductase [Mycobacterium kyorinense]ORV95916.1 monooxygenase [Mycobacterium kyorinense]
MSTDIGSVPDHAIVIIGAGFSGIGTAIKLRRAGFEDFVIVDEADGVGGTWHWNTYPGIAVDIPSFSYQYSFEKRRNWSRSYARGHELKAYAEHCVQKYGLGPKIRFDTTVVRAEFDESDCLWRLTTSAGERLTARFVINACGVLTRPVRPEIPGIDDFAGITMHTARWDHTQDLTDKRVGIIGTGASAVQVIPAIAPKVAHLTVFQRTPIWCLPKPDLSLRGTVPRLLTGLPGGQVLTRLASQIFVEATFPIPAHYHGAIPGMSPMAMRLARMYLRSQVHDPVVRDRLTPRYGLGCKRPAFHNEYLATYNRDNVYLETEPIVGIDRHSVRVLDGSEHPIDVLILATGFKVMDPDNMPTYELIGVGGVDQRAYWDTHRLQAYEGVSLPGFPNHFSIMGPYGYNGSSYFALIEAQSTHIIRCLKHARARNARYVEVTQEANDRYFAEMMRRRRRQIFWQDSCASANSYYFDKNGDVPLRPTTTLESAWRSRRFNIHDYRFGVAPARATTWRGG